MIAAANYRDQMRSHFLARSARQPRRARDPDPAAARQHQAAARHGPDHRLRRSGRCSRSAAAPRRSRPRSGSRRAQIKGLGADIGTCGVDGPITTEDDKINVNCANGNDATAATLKSALDALIYFPAYDPVFEDADAEGWRRDRATQVAGDRRLHRHATRCTCATAAPPRTTATRASRTATTRRTTTSTRSASSSSSRGVDDRFWTLFGTRSPSTAAARSTSPRSTNTQLIAGDPLPRGEEPERSGDPRSRASCSCSRARRARRKQFGETFTTLDDFITFVKDPARVGRLARGAERGTLAGSAASAALSRGPARPASGEKLGLELDKTKLAQIATRRPAPHLPRRGVGRDRAQAEERRRLAGVSADPLDDHRRVGHQGRAAERHGSPPCRTARGCS